MIEQPRRADRTREKSGLADCVLAVENLALKLRMISKIRRILLLSRLFRSQPSCTKFSQKINMLRM